VNAFNRGIVRDLTGISTVPVAVILKEKGSGEVEGFRYIEGGGEGLKGIIEECEREGGEGVCDGIRGKGVEGKGWKGRGRRREDFIGNGEGRREVDLGRWEDLVGPPGRVEEVKGLYTGKRKGEKKHIINRYTPEEGEVVDAAGLDMVDVLGELRVR